MHRPSFGVLVLMIDFFAPAFGFAFFGTCTTAASGAYQHDRPWQNQRTTIQAMVWHVATA
jgi:hypothetical protein